MKALSLREDLAVERRSLALTRRDLRTIAAEACAKCRAARAAGADERTRTSARNSLADLKLEFAYLRALEDEMVRKIRRLEKELTA